MTILAALSCVIWLWLLTCHGRFWSAGPVLPAADFVSAPGWPPGVIAAHPGVIHATPGAPHATPGAPEIAIIVPARDEAPLIEAVLRSLLAQDYPGRFHVVLVDDRSEDGTGEIARRLNDPRLTVLTGQPRPAGWAGKLWAVQQGVASLTEPPMYVFLTDADIVHAPGHVSALVAMAGRHGLDMVSEMVTLSCDSFAEKALIPAFVFFFQLLYPFAWVNNPRRAAAAAAGGTILLRWSALERIGGMQAVRGALIDDVALARAVKTGGPIFLGHSTLARSVRPYPGAAAIWAMIARSAYAQLRFSPVLLAGTILGMTLVWLIPVYAALFSHGPARLPGFLTWAMAAAAFLPTLARFRRSFLWAVFLPCIALFYMAATIGSAVRHHRGRGIVWKGRAYAGGSP